MNISRFTQQKTGTLLPIKIRNEDDHAFIPAALPPKLDLPFHLWRKLADAKYALGRLDGIGRTLPDPQLLLTPLRRQEAIASSALEGTYATAQELILFEINPVKSRLKNDDAAAWREVANYTNALKEGTNLLENLPFCLKMLKTLHGTLMKDVRGSHTNAGDWREHQVAIGSDRRYVPPPRPQMLQCLDSLEKYINTDDNQYDPLIRAYLVHYQLEAIHPFGDGNGRIGRVVLSLMVGNWCKMYLPWLYMSSFFERYKNEYIDNLFAVSTEGAWEKWIEFCLEGTIRQAEDAITRCAALGELKDKMLKDIQPSGTPRSARIIQGLFSSPIVRVAWLSRSLKVTYPTAQADLQRLVKAGILQPLEGVSPKAFYSPEIMEIAYKDIEL